MTKRGDTRSEANSASAWAAKLAEALGALRAECQEEERSLRSALEKGLCLALSEFDARGGLDKLSQAFEGRAFEASARSVEISERLANELILKRVEQYPLAERQAGLQSVIEQADRAKAALLAASARLKADPAVAIYGALPDGSKANEESLARRFPPLTPDTKGFYQAPKGLAQRFLALFAHRGFKAQWRRASAYQSAHGESAWEGVGRYHDAIKERDKSAQELSSALKAREGYLKSLADHKELSERALDEAGLRLASMRKIASLLAAQSGPIFVEAISGLPEPSSKIEAWIKRRALVEAAGGVSERAMSWERSSTRAEPALESSFLAGEGTGEPSRDQARRSASVMERLARRKRAVEGIKAALACLRAQAGRPSMSAVERAALKPPEGLGSLMFAKCERWSLGARAGLLMGLGEAPSRLALEGFGFGEIKQAAAVKIANELTRAGAEGEAGAARAERALALAALEASRVNRAPRASGFALKLDLFSARARKKASSFRLDRGSAALRLG